MTIHGPLGILSLWNPSALYFVSSLTLITQCFRQDYCYRYIFFLNVNLV